jgi:5-methylcytosine-specific restriction endonuclease McrA
MSVKTWQIAKQRYLAWYEETYDYVHCLNEDCKNPNEHPHSVHHIYSRSKYPRHKEIHNMLNLIMLCQKCHDKFHHGKTKDDYIEVKRLTRKWSNERGLHKLFRRTR